MENIGSFYDNFGQRNTTQANAPTVTQAQNSETKISDSFKWASRILTAVAILGWIVVVTLILDAMCFNNKLMEWIVIGQ